MSGVVPKKETPDLAILTRGLVSATLASMMRNAGDLSPTRKTQWTLTGNSGESPVFLNAAAWHFHHAEL